MRFRTATTTLEVLALMVGLSAAVRAQDQGQGPSILHRALQVASIAAPTLDLVTTLHNVPYGNITEANPILRGPDGAAVPWRVATLKAVESSLLLGALSTLQHRSRKTKAIGYIIVGGLTSIETAVAIHNARLEGTYYRYRRHY